MKYFQKLPKVLTTDKKGVSKLYTNIMARASIMDDLFNTPLLFYSYDIQNDDTPEIVAEKFYGNSYRYWIVLLSNNIIDPQWDWPLNSEVFNKYISDKYQDFDPYTTIYEYQKIITKYDSLSQTTDVEKQVIDQNTFDYLTESTTEYTFPSTTTTVSITKNSKTYFEYELEKNEAKRNIKLLKKEYAPQIENELKRLMEQ